MSICPDKINISLYVDNELNHSHKKSLEKHLDTCEHCSKQLAQYKNIRRNLNLLSTEYNTETGYERLKTRQRYKSYLTSYRVSKDPLFFIKLTPVLAAAAVLAVLLPLTGFFSGLRSSPQDTPVLANNVLGNYLFPSVNAITIAPMQERGVVADDAIAGSRISETHTVMLDATTLTEIDVFKPAALKNNNPIEIIMFDSPALVLHETDTFGFSIPVFLLREQ